MNTIGEANDDARAHYAPDAQSSGTVRYCFLQTSLHGDPAAKVHMRRAKLRYPGHRAVEDDPGYGNGDGVADPGETVRLVVTLENVGDESASDANARLFSSDESVTVHDDTAAWPGIAPGESAELTTVPFSASFSGACGTSAPFRLEIRHDGVVDVSVFSVGLGERSEWALLRDEFESDAGWETGSDANARAFVRDDPHGVVLAWATPEADAEDDPARFFPVFRAREPAGGFEEAGEPCLSSWRDAGLGDAAFGSRSCLVRTRYAAGDSQEGPFAAGRGAKRAASFVGIGVAFPWIGVRSHPLIARRSGEEHP
jgi:hypothetical protein